jgi:amino acid transporter
MSARVGVDATASRTIRRAVSTETKRPTPAAATDWDVRQDTELVKGLGLTSASMLVMGSMIGSAIFIVPAEISREVNSPALLIGAYLVTGFLTIVAALCYGELAAMMPRAGGQYIYLRHVRQAQPPHPLPVPAPSAGSLPGPAAWTLCARRPVVGLFRLEKLSNRNAAWFQYGPHPNISSQSENEPATILRLLGSDNNDLVYAAERNHKVIVLWSWWWNMNGLRLTLRCRLVSLGGTRLE